MRRTDWWLQERLAAFTAAHGHTDSTGTPTFASHTLEILDGQISVSFL